jgi:hypothetical protein
VDPRGIELELFDKGSTALEELEQGLNYSGRLREKMPRSWRSPVKEDVLLCSKIRSNNYTRPIVLIMNMQELLQLQCLHAEDNWIDDFESLHN